jgi:hypothetical protein
MNSLCPVCNALQEWDHTCPECGRLLTDQGRLTDWYGPYSAYRPIEALSMAAGPRDRQAHICCHAALCETCGRLFEVPVGEWI